MGEVEAPPEVLLCVLPDGEAGSLEVDQDRGQEIVVNIITTLVFFHQKSDVPLGQDTQEFVHLRLPDHHDSVPGALLLRA